MLPTRSVQIPGYILCFAFYTCGNILWITKSILPLLILCSGYMIEMCVLDAKHFHNNYVFKLYLNL